MPDGHSHRWTIDFRDGTSIEAITEDDVNMRQVTSLARHDPVVVGRVRPEGRSARVVIWAPRHGEFLVDLRV